MNLYWPNCHDMAQVPDSTNLGLNRSPDEEQHSSPNENLMAKSIVIPIRRPGPIRQHNTNTLSTNPLHKVSGISASKKKRNRATAATTLVKRKPDTAAYTSAQCAVRIGDIVDLSQLDGITQRFAKVSELCPFHSDQFAVVCVWLYSREEIAEDLIRNNISSDKTSWHLLNERWSSEQGRYDGDEYMLSTKRTIALWDATVIKCAPDAVATKICQSFIYNTDPSERSICDVNDPTWRWMKKILTLKPAGHAMQTLGGRCS